MPSSLAGQHDWDDHEYYSNDKQEQIKILNDLIYSFPQSTNFDDCFLDEESMREITEHKGEQKDFGSSFGIC